MSEYKLFLNKVIKAQRIVKNFVIRRRLAQITPELFELYYHPTRKGGYFCKKDMMEFVKVLESEG